ncbi:response regulator [Pontiella sulfatireligans]|uniref:Response regulator MprA n=1 Tax=Pontiella sulfatireligans TaxID=2750658 RepID=A0A6C2UHY8_9BACT|nr:response regulator [Pontiella sulfatireligans]VGO19810.1 Response regulator MprA [Pontiella sulfatireligans]
MARILIIDDDETIRNVFKRFLAGKGHVVEVASNGREGLRLIEAEMPELVITDIMMPETDGLEVVMAVRGKCETVPIIAISGGMHAMPMDFLPMAKKFGARKVLYKPVELDDLLAAVDEVLGD